jgi:uncharacterized OB-fold protein
MKPAHSHPIIDRDFPVDPGELLPMVTAENAPFWDGLVDGRLLAQVCASCGAARFPIAPICPHCGSEAADWQELSGRGTVFSWVRYHRSYLPEFVDLLPYVVALVQLDGGPRMFARLIDPTSDPAIGDVVSLVIERWPDGRHVPAFALSGEKQ